MSFSQIFIERVREANNIVDIIGQYTELKNAGARRTGLCPFPDHNEKSPSFSVAEDRQLYHCFGCGKGGNLYTFLREYRGMSFPEAVEFLADRAGIPMEREEKEDSKFNAQKYQKSKDEKKSFLQLNQLTADFYHYLLNKLPSNHAYRDYLKKRKLTPEMVEKFKLGIAPKEWNSLTNMMQKKNVSLDLGVQMGLAKKRNKGDGYFDLFRERLMFPIFSPNGEVLGFGGRTLGDDPAKYMNSPETPVFNKGKTLYGLHETAKFIRTEDQVIVVEGYMDLLALYSAGIKNVVAVLGTALTGNHARLLKRYTKNVIVLFDGDSAGRRAAERSLSILLAGELLPKEVVLPNGQDPDDFLNEHGVEAMRRQMAAAPEFYISYLERCLRENGSGSMDKVKTVDQVGPVLLQVGDSRLRMLYFRETIDRLGVEENWLKQALRDLKKKAESGLFSSPALNQPQSAPPPEHVSIPMRSMQQAAQASNDGLSHSIWKIKALSKAELSLIQLGVKSKENWDLIQASPNVIEVMSETTRQIFSWLSEVLSGGSSEVLGSVNRQATQDFGKLPALLASRVDTPNFVTAAVNFSASGAEEGNDKKQIRDCLKWIHDRYLKGKSKEMTHQMTSGFSKEQLEQFMNIQRQKRSLGKED